MGHLHGLGEHGALNFRVLPIVVIGMLAAAVIACGTAIDAGSDAPAEAHAAEIVPTPTAFPTATPGPIAESDAAPGEERDEEREVEGEKPRVGPHEGPESRQQAGVVGLAENFLVVDEISAHATAPMPSSSSSSACCRAVRA